MDRTVLKLDEARLCLDCEAIHTEDSCPRCASDAFAFIAAWIPSMQSRRVAKPRPARKLWRDAWQRSA